MANAIWQATITDQSGNILPGAEVTVVNETTGLSATLFSTRTGTAKSNPFFADANGFAQFYAAPGLYRITATSSGTGTTQTWRYVRLVDVSTTAEAISGAPDVLLTAAGGHSAIRGLSVGTVSQSGGVPTGAIIESGSNANGRYVKYADGTMICYRSDSIASIVNTTSYTIQGVTVYRNEFSWTFPSAFSSTTLLSVVSSVRQSTNDSFVSSFPSGISTSAVNLMCTSLYSWVSYARVYISAIAIGRWY